MGLLSRDVMFLNDWKPIAPGVEMPHFDVQDKLFNQTILPELVE